MTSEAAMLSHFLFLPGTASASNVNSPRPDKAVDVLKLNDRLVGKLNLAWDPWPSALPLIVARPAMVVTVLLLFNSILRIV
ncbi:MAG: hypothetical protein QM594_00490 [Niabella sp.]